jgi:DinB family protein
MPALDDALTANREAAKRFLATARTVAKEAWAKPIAPGKWSPAQIVEHVAISTEVALKAIKGDKTVGSFPRLFRAIPRAMVFNPTLKKGAFPKRMKGPAIFAPSKEHISFDASAARIERAVTSLEAHVRDLAKAGTHAFDHGFFGRLKIADYVRFNGLHANHHEKQLPPRPK